ncbi:MAG: molybdopterin-binding domain of aldehyde dehydrogenase family protein [Rhodospirillales bacterium]|nr:molybdopterin-binding domain of aldehyde dehydrogenase family protein [Rhodospirillales bacterium]
MTRIVNLSRRKLLKAIGGGSGLVLGVYFSATDRASAIEEPARPLRAGFEPGQLSPNVFVAMDPTGQVTLTVSRPEMGQGIRTTFAMIMADELAAAWPRIVVRQSDGDAKYGDQITDASRSILIMERPLRLAAASVRQMLEAAAAQTWRALIADCRAVDHEVIHVPTARVLPYAQLVKTAMNLPVPNPDKLRLRDSSSRRYIGHAIPSIDMGAMLKGKTPFGADVTLPGIKYASIERCPVYGGKVKNFDPAGAMAVRGVEKVIEIPANPAPSGHLPLGGIAVIASNSWAAFQGRKKLKIEWDLGSNASHDTTAYRAEMQATARRTGKSVRTLGNFESAYAGAAIRVVGEYFVPYQTHATMEPPVAVAAFENSKLIVMAPTQSPQTARAVLAQYLDLKEADIVVRPTFLGNGFGRKALHDYICEAGWLAKATNGRIKVVWTREDDIKHGYYQPICFQRLDGGLDKNGVPIAWRHRTVFPSLASTFHADQVLPDAAQLGQGFVDMPYAIPNLRCEVGAAPAHMRLGPGRGGLNMAHTFAMCSFIDELASAAGKDPANFLFTYYAGPKKIDMKALGVDYPNYSALIEDYPLDVGRLQNVLQFAMDRASWGDPLLPRQGRGLAVHRSFLSYAAAIIVVTVAENGQISIPRIDLVIDCGQVINPDRVKALMEDSIMYGLGFALYGEVTVKNGAVEQRNFDDYPVARAVITPEMHIHVVPSGHPPTGAGDPAVPVIAPALCNAIFAATGKRIRTLPIDLNLLKDAPATAPVPTAGAPAAPTAIPLTPAGPAPKN